MTAARVSHEYAEAIIQVAPKARVSHLYAETMATVTAPRVSHVFEEGLLHVVPQARVSHAFEEGVVHRVPDARVSHSFLEAIIRNYNVVMGLGDGSGSMMFPEPVAYSAAVLADSPRDYWTLIGASATARDNLGSGTTDLTVGSGTPTHNDSGVALPAGMSGFGTSFASGAYLIGSGIGGNLSSPVTFEAWIRFTGSTNASAPPGFGGFGANADNQGLHFRMGAVFPDPDDISVVNGGSAGVIKSNSIGSTWYHIVWVQVNSTTARGYVNGVKTFDGAFSMTNPSAGSHIYIGTTPTPYSASRPWTGQIIQVADYPSALSDSRVLAHYNAGAGL